MAVRLPSFAKINVGLCLGPRRADGFHELRTVYQTIALHDFVQVEARPGEGIEIRCSHPAVPRDSSNTCYRMVTAALPVLGRSARVVVEIEKRLPVQAGLGAGSSNAAAALLGLERALGVELSRDDRLRLAAEVGSDVPLFLIGGTAMGTGRGEQVSRLPDLPALPVVVVTPAATVSTPAAFQRWDETAKLTEAAAWDRINSFSQSVTRWLGAGFSPASSPALWPTTGVPVKQADGDRAEALLLDLVRTGIENDFERVVFSDYPELRDMKRALEREGAAYASLSGSGAALYGLFAAADQAQRAVQRLQAAGVPAVATCTLPRAEYWQRLTLD